MWRYRSRSLVLFLAVTLLLWVGLLVFGNLHLHLDANDQSKSFPRIHLGLDHDTPLSSPRMVPRHDDSTPVAAPNANDPKFRKVPPQTNAKPGNDGLLDHKTQFEIPKLPAQLPNVTVGAIMSGTIQEFVQFMPNSSSPTQEAVLEMRRTIDYPPFVMPLPNFPLGSRAADLAHFRAHAFVKEHMNALDQCKAAGLDICQDVSRDTHAAFVRKDLYCTGSVDVVRKGHLTCRLDMCGGFCGWQVAKQSDQELFWLRGRNERVSTHRELKRMIYMVVPEEWAFQHFVPDIGPKIAQAWDFLQQPDVRIFIDEMRPGRSPMVPFLWTHLGLQDRLEVLAPSETAYDMEELIVDCISPSIHPLLGKKFQDIVGVAPLPLEERQTIVWMSRSTGAHNPGRRIVNEKEALASLTEWATSQNLDLEVFDHSRFHNARDIIAYFNKAKMMIGPHGGAMLNLWFAPAETVVVEFFPRELYDRVGGTFIVWLSSAHLNQQYWRIHSAMSGSDMTIDIPELLQVLTLSIS